MGYECDPNDASVYAFQNIDSFFNKEKKPFFWCFGHCLQHKCGDEANVELHSRGGIYLKHDVTPGGCFWTIKGEIKWKQLGKCDLPIILISIGTKH